MSNPDLSARMGRACMEGFDSDAHHIITGCSGCVMQLSAAAPKGTEVRHWLDYAEV
jgi:glycolate oxidase iron-sulfur subunit